MTRKDDRDSLQRTTHAYYSSNPKSWLKYVYADPKHAKHFPFGRARELVVKEAIATYKFPSAIACDLGCGGGHLSRILVENGFYVYAVDFSHEMLDLARQLLRREGMLDRTTLVCSDLLSSSIETRGVMSGFVIAMGIIEYVNDIGLFFSNVSRLLDDNGVLLLEFRNRLFNVLSGNMLTLREAERHQLAGLVKELEDLWAGMSITERDMLEYVAAITEAERNLTVASEVTSVAPPDPFPCEREMHTIQQIAEVARARGLLVESVFGLHPHPFPPSVEHKDPYSYNKIAWALQQRPRNPLVLISCSSWAAVLKKSR